MKAANPLWQVRKQRATHCRPRRPDNSPLVVGVYSAEQILVANGRHDARNGWTKEFPAIFTNLKRFPETVVGSIFDFWEHQHLNGHSPG